MVLALHEEVAVAIAHGYSKATGAPMGVLLHDLVGLQHASMAIFNAWVDQVSMIVLGGSGPSDSERRRPWIDWIHSPRWQSLTVRDVVKWDDAPVSIHATLRSLAWAHRHTLSAPRGPTYVALDVLLQEAWLDDPPPRLDRPDPPTSITASAGDLTRVVDLLTGAEQPVILADTSGRSREGYAATIELAEALGAPVVDLGGHHNFPNDHWADRSDERAEVLAEADVVLCLDVRDVRWALSTIDLVEHGSRSLVREDASVVTVGLNELHHIGFLDREAPDVADLAVTADTAVALPTLLDEARKRVDRDRVAERKERHTAKAFARRRQMLEQGERERDRLPIAESRLALEVWTHIRDLDWVLANGTLRGWARRLWDWSRFGCFLGTSGGAGLGYGLGASIGAALALRESGSVVVDLQADGDLLYTPEALWTAAHLRLPLLVIVANNRSYGKDRLHQATVARARGRSAENIDIGIDIDDPPVDLARLARAQGVEGIGPVIEPENLAPSLGRAVAAVREGRPALVDVIVERSA